MARKRKAKKKLNKIKLFFYIIFLLTFLLLIDKFTFGKTENLVLKFKYNRLKKNNPDSLIISIKADENQIANIPIISFNEIDIDWGDGTKEKYISKKTDLSSNDFEDYILNNTYNNILIPRHKYNKKGIYDIVITGDTKRGMFGSTSYTTIDSYGKKVFLKEFLSNIDKINSMNLDKNSQNRQYYDLLKEEYNRTDIVNSEIKNRFVLKYNIIQFKNLNFKAIGNLANYFTKEIPIEWVDEFVSIEAFIDSFAHSNISNIPENIFEKSKDLRILSGTFMNCKYLEIIPEKLFTNLNNIENLRYCFAESRSLTGNAPKLWEEIDVFKIENPKELEDLNIDDLPYLLCFDRCNKLANYSEIPFLWGGILESNKGDDL